MMHVFLHNVNITSKKFIDMFEEYFTDVMEDISLLDRHLIHARFQAALMDDTPDNRRKMRLLVKEFDNLVEKLYFKCLELH